MIVFEKLFPVGQRVLLREDSRYYSVYSPDDSCNPIGIEGTVIEPNEEIAGYGHPIHVKWDNGRTNYYSDDDLERVS